MCDGVFTQRIGRLNRIKYLTAGSEFLDGVVFTRMMRFVPHHILPDYCGIFPNEMRSSPA